MKDKLFDALFGVGPAPDRDDVVRAAARVVFSPDGLILIRAMNPCLRPVYKAENGHTAGYMEGRRSVLLDIINYALAEEKAHGRR
jgi:hypothetical protein